MVALESPTGQKWSAGVRRPGRNGRPVPWDDDDVDDVPIRDEAIRLGQFLKLANLIDTGSDAKALMIEGRVQVNGEVETRRGRQLVKGDVVELAGQQARVG
jgi:ribosome-associated protein